MINPMRPVFLDGYDIFQELETWVREPLKGSSERNWAVGRHALGGGRPGYRCELTWNLDGQCARLYKYATSPEEAVYTVLVEFRRTQGG